MAFGMGYGVGVKGSAGGAVRTAKWCEYSSGTISDTSARFQEKCRKDCRPYNSFVFSAQLDANTVQHCCFCEDFTVSVFEGAKL